MTTVPVRVFSLGKAVLWLVAAVVFAYLLWLAISNLVSVSDTISTNNAFLRKNGGAALTSSVPWVALVLDVLIAPAAYVVSWIVSRRMSVGRAAVVFIIAFCAAGAIWFDLLEYVSATGRVGA
jgi:hypothetical protein